MVLLQLQVRLWRMLRFATQFVTLLAAHTAFVTAAFVSFTPLRSLRPPFRYISPRALPFQCSRPGNHFLASFIILMNHQITNDQTRFIESLSNLRTNALALPCRSQASSYHKILANGHWVPFRSTTAFIHFSSIQSTRCQ
jgi:hypothetical protein